MLKFPIGWAAADRCAASARAHSRRAIPLARIRDRLSLAAPGVERFQRALGLGGVPRMEVGIRRESLAEIARRRGALAERPFDHAGVIEEPRVPGAELEGRRHLDPRPLRLAGLVERPGEEIVRVDVLS